MMRTVTVVAAVLLLFDCSGPTDMAGGTTSTDNARVCGSVVLQDGTPVPDAAVRIRTADYLSAGPANAETDAFTDDSGRFSLGPVAAGAYLIEIDDRRGNGAAVPCSLAAAITRQLETAVALPTGSIRGTAGGPAVRAHLRIRGLERYAAADSQGRFSTQVPAGLRYIVNFTAPDTTIDLPPTDLVEPSAIVFSKTDLGTYSSDSTAVRALLNSLGLPAVPLDSVAQTSTDNRIRSLRLRGRNITALPSSIGSLTFLWEIDAGDNPLEDLPGTLAELPDLRHLFLDATTLAQLPGVVCRCTTLTWLKLSNSSIGTIPADIAALAGLRVLEMSGMSLTEAPEAIFQLAALTDLSLADNRLTSIPDAVSGLSNLKVLHLDDNDLASLPDAITGLRNLTTLYVYRNSLAALPDSIGRLTGLVRLELQENRLGSLPASIAACTGLAYINLWGNELAGLPAGVVNLQPSDGLSLGGNRLCDLPAEIAAWADTFAENVWKEQQTCD